MSRPWLRLVACLTAAAVLVTNTPGLLAAVRSLAAAHPCHQCRNDSHCACCGGHDEETTRQQENRSISSIDEDASDTKTDQQSSCPFCPGGPGHCSWCSVSHVIGAPPAPSLQLKDDAPGHRLIESPAVFPSAF